MRIRSELPLPAQSDHFCFRPLADLCAVFSERQFRAQTDRFAHVAFSQSQQNGQVENGPMLPFMTTTAKGMLRLSTILFRAHECLAQRRSAASFVILCQETLVKSLKFLILFFREQFGAHNRAFIHVALEMNHAINSIGH